MWRALRGPPEIMSEPARPSHDTQLRGLIYRSATTSGVVPSVPTPFLVEAGSLRTYANCIWDALGVPIMLRREARIVTSCGCCGERMVLWWNDIVFT